MTVARYYDYMVVRVLLHGQVIVIKNIMLNCYECARCEGLTRYVTRVVIKKEFVCFGQSTYRPVFEYLKLCLL